MKFSVEVLINELIVKTKENISFANDLKLLLTNELNKRINEDSWSILECLEHLNLYGNFYLAEISDKIENNYETASKYFKSGILGNYFANSMLPKKKLNKMKTFKSMNPIFTDLDKKVIVTFIEQQYKLIELLEYARSKNLTKIKTNISISKWLKIRLGDTFRFVINHNLRHIQQIKNILNAE